MKRNNIRLWPLCLVLLINLIATTWFWTNADMIRQDRITGTLTIEILTLLLTVVWLLFLSRLKLKSKLFSFSATVLCITLFFSLFKINDLSGDLMPEFSFRWNKNKQNLADVTPANEQPNSSKNNSPHFDYPQFLGPNRNAIFDQVNLNLDWQNKPPKLIWKQSLGQAWSAFAVYENFAITQEQRENREAVISYELTTGKVIWIHTDETRYETVLGGIGPRATPTIAENKVYTLGATGILNCLDLFSGAKLWSNDIKTENNATMPEWGYSGSPLVVDSLVVVCAGGANQNSLIAYQKDSGRKIWSAGSDPAGYSSPMLAELAGTQQIVLLTHRNVMAHKPQTGEILWQFPWPGETQRVAQPVVVNDNQFLISTGYGVGSKLIEIKKLDNQFKAELVWESKKLKAKFTNLACKDGFVYGLDDGILVCLDTKDGQRRWKNGRYGHGQLILVNDVLLITSEKGEIALVQATPEEFIEVMKIQAISGKTWNNPAFAAPYLLVRNAQEAACLQLALLN